MRNRTFLIVIAGLSVGCAVGPNYKRPITSVPTSFRAPDPLPPQQAASVADLKWFEVFKDDKLQALIRTALERNYDLREAVARVEEARASLGITRANQFPSFGAGGGVEINRLSRDGATPLPSEFLPSQNRNFGSAALQLLSFEVDLWGRLRRATEAARANLKPPGRMVTIAASEETATDERTKTAFFIVEPNQKQLTEIAGLLDARRLRAFVAAAVPLSQAAQAYAGRIQKRGAGKVVVVVATENQVTI
jgi:hypothetical protein